MCVFQYLLFNFSGIGESLQYYDISTSLPPIFEDLTMPNSSSFCGSTEESSTEREFYNHLGSINTTASLPHQDQEQGNPSQHPPRPTPLPPLPPPKQPQNQLSHSLMAPLPVGSSEQVKTLSPPLLIFLLEKFDFLY